MSSFSASAVVKQHLIDPEICIRCNTCETMCPEGAISHDSNNYVVDAARCNWCAACIAPCPTGSIDNYRSMPRLRVYGVAEQLGWDALPAELPREQLLSAALAGDAAGQSAGDAAGDSAAAAEVAPPGQGQAAPFQPAAATELAATEVSAGSAGGSTLPPWSAAHPYTQLYGPKAAAKSVTATVTGNFRVTEVGKTAGSDYDTHHIVLDFGTLPLPVLEGQSVGIVAPGVDDRGRPHQARQYSVASPRNGERPGYNNLSLTVKRVLQDHAGHPVRGVASNYLCDLKVGDRVQVVGPFGSSFLMPNHPKSHIVMICTGTGSAPMRAMTEWRRRERAGGRFEGGRLLLFFGARTQQELPYFGPLQNLPKDFIDCNFAYSRTPGEPRHYVQDAMRARAPDLAALLADANAYFYVCGLRAMEEGVLQALREIAQDAGLDWIRIAAALKSEGRLHLETY
jgi:benzoyl-CoA 2,3-dioxygenase component A